MNGVHDVGGMHGFGEIERDPAGPHLERWEATVRAITMALGAANIRNVDEFRYSIERMDPQDYLNTTYFEHWLDGAVRTLTEKGVMAAGELARRVAVFNIEPEAPLESVFNGQLPYEPPATREQSGVRREASAAPCFAIGDAVRTRNFAPSGHTRLARYARGRHGVVQAHHGCHVFPDSNAMGRGEDPQHLYSVRFEAAELWGEDAGAGESVSIDLWESYLIAE